MKEVWKEAGQLFVMGFRGEAPSRPFLEFLKEERIGGVILFAENCPTHLVARQNIEKIRSVYQGVAPFIAIDQEGGRVCRLKGAPVEYRSAAEYGRLRDLEQFQEEYSRAAMYLEALGVNLNLAPVCDVFVNEKNTVLKGRCFGDTPEQVARFVERSVRVSRTSGLLSCLKHFPGLGDAEIDPHVAVASSKFDPVLWQQRDKIPFEAGINAGADMVMTTHVVLPELDSQTVTGSEKIISALLRGELGFDGPVMTDDLCMEGASGLGEPGERAVAAFNAGHDLLLFGADSEKAMQAYDYFCEAGKRGEIDPKRMVMSLDRIAGVKFRLRRSVLQ